LDIHGKCRTEVGTTDDEFFEGRYTKEGHIFMLFRQTAKSVTPALSPKIKIAYGNALPKSVPGYRRPTTGAVG